MLVDAAALTDLDRHLDPILPFFVGHKGHAVAHDAAGPTQPVIGSSASFKVSGSLERTVVAELSCGLLFIPWVDDLVATFATRLLGSAGPRRCVLAFFARRVELALIAIH